MRIHVTSILLGFGLALGIHGHAAYGNDNDKETGGVSHAVAKSSLDTGNKRFTLQRTTKPHQNLARVKETATEQKPFACVLTCSDSRVSPEILFDQGIGDLFVVRVAGNVSDTDEIGSIEYAVGHLHTPILVVMGHSHCGAVKAVASGAVLPPTIKRLTDNIEPAVARCKAEGFKGEELVEHSVRENVVQSINDVLHRSDEVRKLVGSGKLKVYGAVYHLDSGLVEWLDGKP